MKIDVLTLFPEMFENFVTTSIIKKAINNNQVEINFHNFRDYSTNIHKKVDDYPCGGGEGMVLMCQPIFDCLKQIKTEQSITILLTPQGQVYKQKKAYELALKKHIILICGHYEGFDERILSQVDLELSIGDYILTGGEVASMVIIDSVVRLVDGVIKQESHENESFQNNLLDYPVYTKPIDYEGMKVPEVLLSGHHKNINEWRLQEQIKKTKKNRPDLLGVD